MPLVRLPDGTRLFYETIGTGEPLLLIAGQSGDHHAWDRLRETYATRYQVTVFDWRGTGQSDKPQQPPYSTRGFAQDVIALLDAVSIERSHVFGVSMGGRVGQWLGIDYSDRNRRPCARLHDTRQCAWGRPARGSKRALPESHRPSRAAGDDGTAILARMDQRARRPACGETAASTRKSCPRLRPCAALSSQRGTRFLGFAAEDQRSDVDHSRKRRQDQPDGERPSYGRAHSSCGAGHRAGRSAWLRR